MSDGILIPESTVAVVMKNGTQLTTNALKKPEEIEQDFLDGQNNNAARIYIATGDRDGTVIYLMHSELAMFSVAKYVPEEEMHKRMRDKMVKAQAQQAGQISPVNSQPSRILKPR